VGQLDALQFTGPGEDRITLPGIVYCDFRGDASQISQLRNLASGGRPLRLIASTGEILGRWVIESVEETQSMFKPDGAFRRQEFNLTIRKFSDDADV
jgi:phage protein U